MSKVILCGLALAGGICIAVQAPINAQLAAGFKNPVATAAMSFFVGFVFLLLATLALRLPLPSLGSLKSVPAYAWFSGGLLGAFFVGLNLYIVPKLGAAALIGLAITGQLIASVTIDHFGLFGLSAHAINTGRIFGVALLTLGAALVLRF